MREQVAVSWLGRTEPVIPDDLLCFALPGRFSARGRIVARRCAQLVDPRPLPVKPNRQRKDQTRSRELLSAPSSRLYAINCRRFCAHAMFYYLTGWRSSEALLLELRQVIWRKGR